MRTKSDATMPSSFATSPFSTRSSKKARSSCRSLSSASKVYFRSRSASVASSERSANAISGSIIPELGEMAAGVGVLGAEGRPERVDFGEREAVGFDIELAGHGEKRLAAEEILGEVDLALRRARQVGEVE